MMSGSYTEATTAWKNGSTTNAPVICVLKKGDHNAILQVQASFAMVLLPINLFLLVCLIVQRKRLRTRLVCMYGLNVVLASTLGSTMRVYDTFSQNFGKPYLGDQFTSDTMFSYSYLYWWAFEKSTLVMLFLVFYASIAMITMTLHTSMLRISGTVAGVDVRKSATTQILNRSKLVTRFQRLSKATRARIFIALSWIVPCTIILISVTVDNCALEYVCPFDYERADQSQESQLRSSCTRDLAPLSNQTVYITVAMCVISMFVLACALIRSYVDFRRISNELGQHCHVFHLSRENSFDHDGNAIEVAGEGAQSGDNRTSATKTGSMLLEKTKRDLLTILIISVIYVIGIMASILFVFIDSMTTFYLSPSSFYVKLVFLNLPNVVETISSVLLCAFINPISSAIKATLRRVLGFCCPCLYRLR